jgi:hypothetical protein
MFTEILENAPEGATHYLVNQYDFLQYYIRLHECLVYCYGTGAWVENDDMTLDGNHHIQALEDLRQIMTLQAKVALLEKSQA